MEDIYDTFEELVEQLCKDAMQWGWAQDVGYGPTVYTDEQNFKASKERLLGMLKAYLPYKEN